MSESEIELVRQVEAIQIPSGDEIVLPMGLKVVITQSLGGTYTVATEQGLARIAAKDADALGDLKEIEAEATQGTGGEKGEAQGGAASVEDLNSSNAPKEAEGLQKEVWGQLMGVYDPEIPVNIVDLGLVYGCELKEEGGKTDVEVKMTLTAPGCGMGPTIAADAQSRIMTLDGIGDAKVELVWDPAWNQDMISEEGKMQLGMI